MREHLKLQQELFLSYLLDRLVVAPPSSTPIAPGGRKVELENILDLNTWNSLDLIESTGINTGYSNGNGGYNLSSNGGGRERGGREAEARELMLETVGHFSKGDDLVDIWVNYDCHIEGEDLFERMIKFLCRVCHFFM